jgi:hypothetical protein
MAEITQHGKETPADADHAVERIERWSGRAASVARTAAERVPAGVAIVVGGGILLALDAFGVGEVITAGVGAYAAYRLLRRSARKHAAKAEAEAAR